MEFDDGTIVSFCDITGATPEQARAYLEMADGVLESAVGLFLEQPDLASNNNAASNNAPVEIPYDAEDYAPPQQQLQEDDVRAPIAPTRQTLLGDDPFFHAMPSNTRSVNTAAGPDPFRAFQQFIDETEGATPQGAFAAGSADDRLARLFAPPTEIMYKGPFEQAREIAKEEKKWLMVTLHDPSEFPCQILNRDLWKDENVVGLVKENFIFMQMMTLSEEGKRYKTFYPVDSLPHIAIIDPRTGERVHEWHTAVTPNEFISDVVEFLSTYSLQGRSLPNRFTKKQKRVEEMTEEEQLEAAIAASVNSSAQPPSEVFASASSTSSTASLPSSPAAKLAALPTSELIAAKERPDPTPSEGDVTSVQIRLPDGKRFVKKFLKNDTVRCLFAHVKFAVPELQSKPFEIVYHREPLSKKLSETLQDAQLVAAAVNVDFL